MISKEFEVKKVGWNDENPSIPIVLLEGLSRELLSIAPKAVVKVIRRLNANVELASLAFVQPQFKEFVNNEVVSINSKLAEALSCEVGSKIIVTKEVTEGEVERFKEENRIWH